MSKHGLSFSIEGVVISVDEMGSYVARTARYGSERDLERFSNDAAEAIYKGVLRKVQMGKASAEHARIRKLWKQLHPCNHAGYYYCHICGGWVHEDAAELDHIVPGSVEKINTDIEGWDDKLRMAHGAGVLSVNGKVFCIGNQGKGSKLINSATMEIAPPDEEA